MKSRETISKSKFLRMFATNLNITQAQAESVLDAYHKTLSEALETGKPVIIGDIVKLQIKIRPSVKRKNPQTGEDIICPKVPYIRSTLATKFKDLVKTWLIY